MPPRFVRRERKHKRLAKTKDQYRGVEGVQPNDDTNTFELTADNNNEREQKRRRLNAELRPETKISSKKKKRLEKYIDVKLRKDEIKELLTKLEASKVDTSLFQSSKKLGRTQESKRERFQRALDERAAGIADGEEILFEQRRQVEQEESEPEIDSSEISDSQQGGIPTENTVSARSTFGSGLKRPLAVDERGQPILKKRKRNTKSKQKPVPMAPPVIGKQSYEHDSSDDASGSDLGEDEWNGFSSDGTSSAAEIEEDESDMESETSLSDEEMRDGDNSDGGEDEKKAIRVSAFKQWADAQRNSALGFTPSSTITDMSKIKINFQPREASPELRPPTIATSKNASRPNAVPTISRADDVQKARLELPVVQEEQKIMEAVNNNPVVVVCGATGSGKTTQVPQMLYENGYASRAGEAAPKSDTATASDLQSYGMIGITQPRRVAATSVAERVAYELGQDHRKRVAHQVRYDTNVSRNTAIKFMTDGVLLREIQQDFILSKYSVIVVDEAHERSVNTDILIGILSRIVSLREDLTREEPGKHYPLKLIIMSATLRINDFLANARLFKHGTPPVVEAEGRQYPVTVHFSRRTRRDYVDEMVEKVSRGHKKLPSGAMLVFLTGQQEIQNAAKRLRERLGVVALATVSNGKLAKEEVPSSDFDDMDDQPIAGRSTDYIEDINEVVKNDVESNSDRADDDADEEFIVEESPQFPQTNAMLKPLILPLYAALPAAEQMRVFQPPPEGHRLIILATNVAETSITIPGVRYVFDCGRSKEKKCDDSNVQTFEIDWISKASAAQRSGRAGRTGPGHCYRLYSSAVFENYFEEHSAPEILRTPLESTILQLKAMEVDNVVNFPFPTPPDLRRLAQAEQLLKTLGAISEISGKITERGRALARFPLNPRYGVMMLLAERNNAKNKTIAIVAGLAVGELFVPELQAERSADKDEDSDSSSEHQIDVVDNDAQRKHQAYGRAQATLSRWDDHSDAIKLLTTVAAHAEASQKSSADNVKFCADFFLREKGMQEVQQLRKQLHSIIMSQIRAKGAPYEVYATKLPLPSEKERAMLNQIVAAGFIDQVAVRADTIADTVSAFGRKPRRAVEVPYRTLVPSTDGVDRTASSDVQEIQKSVFVHASSVLARLSPVEMPQYIVYSHISRAAPSQVLSNGMSHQKRVRIHPLTSIGPKALAALAEGTPLLVFGKSIGKIKELPNKRRECWVGISLRAPGGDGPASAEWPLGAWKLLQKRNVRGGWDVEKVLAR